MSLQMEETVPLAPRLTARSDQSVSRFSAARLDVLLGWDSKYFGNAVLESRGHPQSPVRGVEPEEAVGEWTWGKT